MMAAKYHHTILATLIVSLALCFKYGSAQVTFGAKNGYPGMSILASIWMTFGGNQYMVDNAICIKSGDMQQLFDPSTDPTYNAILQSELKQNQDCTGETISVTTINCDEASQLATYHDWSATLLPQTGGNFPNTYWAPGIHPVAPSIQSSLPPATPTMIISGTADIALVFRVIATGQGDPRMTLAPNPNNPNCVVSAGDDACDVVLVQYNAADTTQVWLRQPLGSGYIFINQALGLLLSAQVDAQGTPLKLVSINSANLITAIWTIGGDCHSQCALRPSWDNSLNMNVLGSGPYAPGNVVAIWSWNGGSPNEVWSMTSPP